MPGRFPPIAGSAEQNIFRIAYWRDLANEVNGGAGVAPDDFWDDHAEAPEARTWQGFLPVLHEIDEDLRRADADREPQLYIYKTRDAQHLRDLVDWHCGGGLTAFRRFIYNETWRQGPMSDAAIARHFNDNLLLSPIGGHVGSLAAIREHLQEARPGIVRFKMRKGVYGTLFRREGRLAFSTAAASLTHAARYFRHRNPSSYLVTKREGGAGEGYLAGWLGVKGEQDHMSFAIGDNAKSRALFSILVGACEWEERPDAQTVDNYETHVWR
jgi:hypothetical protein